MVKVRQVRTAVVWAFACSAGAVLSALGGPIAVIHLFDQLGRQTTAQNLMIQLLFATGLLVAAGLFVIARDRILTRAGLWIAHALGASVLARGLNGVRAPNDLERDRAALQHIAHALPRLSTLFDVALMALPLVVLVFLAPITGAVVVIGFGGGLAVLVHAASRLGALVAAADDRRATADGAWRTAAASSVAVAARGMTAGVVADWQAHDGRAVARGFSVAQFMEQATRRFMVLQLLTWLLVAAAIAGFGMSTAAVASTGGAAVALLLTYVILQSLPTALHALPDLLLAARQLDDLIGTGARQFDNADTVASMAAQSGAERSAPVAGIHERRARVAS